MPVQIRVLKENETTRKRKENSTRWNYQRLYRKNQKNKRLYVQERTITGVSKGRNINIQADAMN